MNFLSIDTSTKYSVVAIRGKHGKVYGCRRLFENGRADRLSLLIAECLKRSGLAIGAVDYFGVGVGPGSFTGLRIGLSIIKGLSYALKKPCLIFSSLDAIAFNKAPYKKGRLCVMVDAKRSNVYSRFYDITEPSANSFCVKAVSSKDAILSLSVLLQRAGSPTVFSGDAIDIYRGDILAKVKDPQLLAQRFWYPTPESIILLALESLRLKKVVDCFKLSANYLYAQDCQVRPVLNR
ncbi:MAG: tRNA (adenosine(37)-N6)-threonylcarbamoyltransferase complex dimerization subunit type 1 TsaB [Candidatus Omnitrophica bacterium CG1_02_44_16]|nr:MAG: tRNA (adenosine(37)-N6)-threonylcarbamoyltransferase complex dimerization subunit type 1 TsaB [Candidatus Omnitrophica bacterium CG1_02_44_16]PIY82928.1 MAG: tRNA (adenosine(37)-N6)-threonylcarbamoyltransferase complex dimerization subunit type 1 TsaB [Candidatus Omnitrophica bacterium CG_4_10_14_0_8_um_filter_44_12]PIZ84264.1 MAG: tRNA (adenosine(37)-N6)-threonylcarbamoyltransferase complex dimerization subunit type 1 TsaB [Candidatus Omnitrophica bacterium CG_4_10_14_0_2_um_filter_44_9]